MMYVIGVLLCPNAGTTVHPRFLRSVRYMDHLGDYDWGGLAFAHLYWALDDTSRRGVNFCAFPLILEVLFLYLLLFLFHLFSIFVFLICAFFFEAGLDLGGLSS